jgi:uncharacterized protein (DUF697 family)
MVATTMGNTEVGENDRHSEVAEIISSAVKWSAGAVAIPLPVVDLIGLGFVQVKMVRNLAKAYGVNPNDKILEGLISAVLATMATMTIPIMLVGSSLKAAPVGGTVLGSVGNAAFGAASTYAIGKVFVRHFEGGGTIASFSADAAKDELKKEVSSATAASR